MISLIATVLLGALVPAAITTVPTAIPTMQTRFDAASAAAEAGKCSEAIADFDALASEAKVHSNLTVMAVINLRRGRCLVQLNRFTDAEPVLRAGLADIDVTKPVARIDAAQGHIGLGRIGYAGFDYPAATREFLAARDLLDKAERFEPLVWLVRSTMFDATNDARVYADEALALAARPAGKSTLLADIHTLHARVLLNHGDIRGGYAELKRALSEQGGLTLKVNSAMIVTRSDLALAALLDHDPDSARQYLAYTGAGHGTPFGRAAVMNPPPCDGDILKPDDSAIVEFGIAADGSVGYAETIYASRLGPTAVAFARAVDGWSWKPEMLKDIAPLFRSVTRVELRCSTASESPPIIETLRHDLGGWLGSRGVAPFTTGNSEAASVAAARAELARRRTSSPGGIALIPVLVALGSNEVLVNDERRAAFDEARTIAARNNAPVGATTLLAVAAAPEANPARSGVAAYRERLRRLLAEPNVAADPRSRSVVRLLLTEPFYRTSPPPDAAVLLRAVANDAVLPEHDPLRSNARVRLASLLAQSGDLPAARIVYDQSGISAQQCALVDARPVLTRAGVSSSDFPQEVLRWGFEGWVQLEFNVAADGHIDGQRAIIAYPPQVFGPAAIASSRGWRYQQTYRPDGVSGCAGAQQQIKFKIAGLH